MSTMGSSMDSPWWLFLAFLGSNSPFHPSLLLAVVLLTTILTWAFSPAGFAWRNGRIGLGRVPIPAGPRGLPFLGSLLSLSDGLPHRALASMARASKAKSLMAVSLGSTPAVVSSDPAVSREILFHSSFANRPVKRSARELMFERAIGFAPSGAYWRLLRRTAALRLFAPHSIASHEQSRQADCDAMLKGMAKEQKLNGSVALRPHLQGAALNNIMGTVFGKRYDVSTGTADKELVELRYLVREGFELLGAFNWSDHLPWLSFFYDPDDVVGRCANLVPRVRSFVKAIVDQHRSDNKEGCPKDFVHVLLSLDGDDKMKEDDIIAVLWEMVFRGTDTTALVIEWAMAELVRHPTVQAKLRSELDTVVGPITDANVSNLPYLKAVVKETLRLHPPGPLLSWARISTSDVPLSNGMVVPAHTTAMVNMWSITHDPAIWDRPEDFLPERFLDADVDVRGGDLRLAPFGAGRRVCPGRNLGLVTVGLWIARLVRSFKWTHGGGAPVDISEELKLSCEMKNPLRAMVVPRN